MEPKVLLGLELLAFSLATLTDFDDAVAPAIHCYLPRHAILYEDNRIAA
jgi:hypothetical protein